MHIAPFVTEQFFARYEFNTPHMLSCSDCETMSIQELLALADIPLEALGEFRLPYTESQGDPKLRAAIAATHSQVNPDHVVILGTPVEGIYLAMQTLVEPEDEVIALMPAYDALNNVAEHICGTVHEWHVRPTDGGWMLDVDELRALINEKTKLLIVNFPHNPTGYHPTPEQFTEIIEVAREHDIWLFCDEMYRGLELGDAQRLPTAVELYEKAVVLAGLSKAQGLPGLRAGWLIVPDDAVRDALINWKHYTSICPPGPIEFLATAALKVNEELMARNRALITENLAAAVPFFERWQSRFTWRTPQAGSIALVGINVPSAMDYCTQLAEEAGILLLPGSCLGASDQEVRFGLGRQNFKDALEHYDEFLLGEGRSGPV